MSVKIQRTKYEPVPEGIYPASIVSIDLDDNSEYGSQVKFRFLLDPFPGFASGKELHAWASASFGPKSKLFKWTQSILGTLPEDYSFDSDDLINKRVMLVIGHTVKPDGAVFDKVELIKPLRVPTQVVIEKQHSQTSGDKDVFPF